MTSDLEDRLRTELPLLADALAQPSAGDGRPAPAPGPGRSRWPLLAGLAAAVLVVVALAAVAVVGGPSETVVDTVSPEPVDHGDWSVGADGLIEARPFALTGWTGTQAIFWAGSSLDRGFAHTDGVAYDPATDRWRPLVGPGWGHPGLSGDFFDGQIYAVAKGGITAVDLLNGTSSEMPSTDDLFPSRIVASDDAVWLLGPTELVGDEPSLAIARFDPATEAWVPGAVYDDAADRPTVVDGLHDLTASVHWTGPGAGAEIVVWGGLDGGVAYDPAADRWRPLDPPSSPYGPVAASRATTTDRGLVVLVASGSDPTGPTTAGVAELTADGWRWLDLALPIASIERVTLAGAGDQLVVFEAQAAPVTVHLPSGHQVRHDDGPLGGVEAPNTVWTGDQLIVWGGIRADGSDPETVVWTPAGR